MNLKPEVARILVREKMVSETAMARLREKTRLLELQYGWSTDTFVKKFNAGEAGDEQAFFQWYALAEAIEDWQKTRESVEELLTASEPVLA